jgi:hypothetical protein
MSHESGYWGRFVKQLEDEGIDYSATFDKDFSWRRMVSWQGDMGKLYPDSLCIFVGGWDTLLMGTRQEIVDFPMREDEILFSGDKVCWPDRRAGEYYEKVPKATPPWLFLNPGPMAAPGWLIREAVAWGESNCPLVGDDKLIIDSDSGTDMRFWTDIFLLSPFKTRIDYRCEFGQTALNEEEFDFELVDGRIRNAVHDTLPIFLHLNGKTIAPEGLK